MTDLPLKAAQYLRMSTEHQRYSIANQAAAIGIYAQERGMAVVQTYSDRGRSGLQIAGRPGLAQLIQDVVAGVAEFRAILVYDVSRWGRFQDADESAHYEFICRQAGMSVHYCAETFDNEGGLAAGLMKSIKRLMAGEYSRELSVKVTAACRRASALGYKQGCKAGFGLRRWVVSESGALKGELGLYERKALQSDRVTLRPGPPEEIALVLRIYRMFIKDRLDPTKIARVLNNEGLVTDLDRRWTYWSVRTVLRSETYVGNHVYGRLSMPLKRLPRRANPPSSWVRADGAFEGIVPKAVFRAAQRIFDGRTRTTNRALRINESVACASDEAMLDILRQLLATQGYLSMNMLVSAAGMPGPSTYVRRFGSIEGAFKQAGFVRPEGWKSLYARRRSRLRYAAVTAELTSALAAVSANCDASPIADVITLDNEVTVEILIAMANAGKNRSTIWCFSLQPAPVARFVIVARLEKNGDLVDYLVINKEGQRYGSHQTSRTCGNALWGRFKDVGELVAYILAASTGIHAQVAAEGHAHGTAGQGKSRTVQPY